MACLEIRCTQCDYVNFVNKKYYECPHCHGRLITRWDEALTYDREQDEDDE